MKDTKRSHEAIADEFERTPEEAAKWEYPVRTGPPQTEPPVSMEQHRQECERAAFVKGAAWQAQRSALKGAVKNEAWFHAAGFRGSTPLREPITVTDADIEAGAVAVNAVKSESGKWSHEFARKIARAAIEAALQSTEVRMSTKRSHEAIADECAKASYETYDDGQDDYSDLFRRAAAALREPITVTDVLLEKCKSAAFESHREAARYECEAQKTAGTFCRGKAFAYTEVRKAIEAALNARSEA